ncbi:MAG: DUF2490 domain-containing protein [Saprospiraceae bacterium]|nr:DUF2490 domain-containing protein [Saprospiraceae bacterium]
MTVRTLLTTMLLAAFSASLFAQNTRLNDHNNIGWWATFGTFKFSEKWGLHAEYQWRRENFVTDWQQSLLRLGANHQVNPKIQLRLGYAWIETYPYGDYPINALGRDFTEHRIFQMLTLTDKPGRLDFTHRFMLEQRWIGRYTSPEVTREDEYFFVNRLRYMFRMQYPLKGNTLDDGEFYAAAYDEIFIGFGKNVNENVFDQNRIGLLLGYRFGPKLRIEGGYFNQILQLPREITLPGESNGRNVFQRNSGFIVNAYLNLN